MGQYAIDEQELFDQLERGEITDTELEMKLRELDRDYRASA